VRVGRDQFLRLQKRYHTDSAIGRLFGISRQAVHRIRVRHGIAPVADRHGRRNAEIARLYRQGLSGEAVARRFRLSTPHVYRLLAAGGVPLRRPPSRHRQP